MSEQKMIIGNEECDFIVKNYEAIQALKECEKRAEKRVPLWLRGELKKILDSKLDGTWRIDEGGDLVNETYYSDENETGCYFGIANLTLEELAAEVEDEGCWVYLYCNFSNKKKPVWKDWNEAVTAKIKENKAEIAKLGYKVSPEDKNKQTLVAKYLLTDLNIKTLAEDPEESIKKTADSVKEFVNNMLKYLVALPQE